jgi:hypothetical protein
VLKHGLSARPDQQGLCGKALTGDYFVSCGKLFRDNPQGVKYKSYEVKRKDGVPAHLRESRMEQGLAASMRLVVAGIDLRRTPDGRWVCVEVNPSPAFVYYEEATGPILST